MNRIWTTTRGNTRMSSRFLFIRIAPLAEPLFSSSRPTEFGELRMRIERATNHSIQRTGANRLGLLQFEPQWRLAPAADAGR